MVGCCCGPEGQPWGPRFTRGVCPADGAPGAEHGSEQHGQDGAVSRAGQVPAGTVLGPQALSPAPGSAGPAHVDLQQVTAPPGASVCSSVNWDDGVAMRIQ